MDWGYALYMVNVVLASLVAGLCFAKASWFKLRAARDARVAGLGLLCVAIVWSALARRNEDIHPWQFLVTAALVLCLYGMRRRASGEFK